jgi:hypothetical protein
MISTTAAPGAPSSGRTVSMTRSSSGGAGAAGRTCESRDDAGPRIASRTADQKCCASRSSRSTDTNATRRASVERSAQARNSEVFRFPLAPK